MDWFRTYHGEVCDPRWLGIARAAGEGVTPGHVYAVWAALKEHASRAVPRGNVGTFDAQALADFTTWPVSLIDSVVACIAQRGMINDGEISDWDDRQPVKLDATNAKRQKRHREKLKARRDALKQAQNVTDSNGRYSALSVTNNDITTTEEIEQSSSSDEGSYQDPNSPLKPLAHNVRGRAGALINVDGFWRLIGEQGMPNHIGIRTIHRNRVAAWMQQGITAETMAEAMRRATEKRARDHNPSPVNFGLLACFIDDVLAGVDAQTATKNGGGYERGDELGREFASVR
jgi:hypothetical protein